MGGRSMTLTETRAGVDRGCASFEIEPVDHTAFCSRQSNLTNVVSTANDSLSEQILQRLEVLDSKIEALNKRFEEMVDVRLSTAFLA